MDSFFTCGPSSVKITHTQRTCIHKTYIHIYMQLHMHVHTMYVECTVCVCVYVCVYVCVCVCVYVCVWVYTGRNEYTSSSTFIMWSFPGVIV